MILLGLQLVVPNVAFWTHKKLAPKLLPKLSKRTSSLHSNTMAVKDGWRLRNVAFWIHKKLAPKWLPRLPKWTPMPHCCSLACFCLAALLSPCLHLVFSCLSLALVTCCCPSAFFRLPYLFCFRLARLLLLLAFFFCLLPSLWLLQFALIISYPWLRECLLWRAPPRSRRGRRIYM